MATAKRRMDKTFRVPKNGSPQTGCAKESSCDENAAEKNAGPDKVDSR